jgi:hypothetical protein
MAPRSALVHDEEQVGGAIEKLLAAADHKQRFRLDPDDPLFIAATIVASIVGEQQLQTQAEISKLVTGLADQVAAASAMAENAARGRSEKIVTQAAEWAAGRIREAGETAAAKILEEAEKIQTTTDGQIKAWKWIAAVCALAAMVSTGVAVWAL